MSANPHKNGRRSPRRISILDPLRGHSDAGFGRGSTASEGTRHGEAVKQSSPVATRLRGLVIAVEDALPAHLQQVLSDRGLSVATRSAGGLSDPAGLIASAKSSAGPSFTAILIPVQSLPPSS